MVVDMASLPATVMLVAGAMRGRWRGSGAWACAAEVQRTSDNSPILTFSRYLKIISSWRTRQSASLGGTVWPAHESWMAVSLRIRTFTNRGVAAFCQCTGAPSGSQGCGESLTCGKTYY